jgi:hypothetical protein
LILNFVRIHSDNQCAFYKSRGKFFPRTQLSSFGLLVGENTICEIISW